MKKISFGLQGVVLFEIPLMASKSISSLQRLENAKFENKLILNCLLDILWHTTIFYNYRKHKSWKNCLGLKITFYRSTFNIKRLIKNNQRFLAKKAATIPNISPSGGGSIYTHTNIKRQNKIKSVNMEFIWNKTVLLCYFTQALH